MLIYAIWTGNIRTLNMYESAEIYPNVGKHVSIYVTLWICLIMRETSRAYFSQSFEYV